MVEPRIMAMTLLESDSNTPLQDMLRAWKAGLIQEDEVWILDVIDTFRRIQKEEK